MLVGSAFGSTPALIEATTTPPPTVEFVVPKEVLQPQSDQSSSTQLSVEGLISRIAEEYGIDSEDLLNLAKCESNLNPDAVGDNGRAFGLTQINLDYWKVTKEQALDPEFNLRFAAEKIKEGKGYLWTCGNCVSYVKTKISGVPKMADMRSNTTLGVGAIALFSYSGTPHWAYVEKVQGSRFLVSECNFEGYTCGTRWINQDDPHIVGYWLSTPAW